MIFSSPMKELEPDATPFRGGRCAAGYPHRPQQPETKKYFDYEYIVPADGVEPSQRPCRARDGDMTICTPQCTV